MFFVWQYIVWKYYFYIESFLDLLGIDYYYEYGIKLFKYRFFHDRYDHIMLDLNVFFWYIYFLFVGVSGNLYFMLGPSSLSLLEIVITFSGILIFALIFDYFTLLKIALHNQEKKKLPYNKIFIGLFVFIRIFLIDIFVLSSISAYFTGMNLSRKQIIYLIIIAQLLRFALFGLLWIIF